MKNLTFIRYGRFFIVISDITVTFLGSFGLNSNYDYFETNWRKF